MDNNLNFQAEDKKIKEVLFNTQNPFRIPRYQRPYAWEEDQTSEFWNDLKDDNSNFIGSLIFNIEPLKEEKCIDIIDGQQRLLTITIFCSALREISEGIDSTLADLIQTKNIAMQDYDGNETFRIQTGDSIIKFFGKYIQGRYSEILTLDSTKLSKEELKVFKNYKYFYNKIFNEINSIEIKDKKLKYIKSLRSKIAELIVIHIKIENEEEAYEIFETTNARGVDLSVSDLLKNLIFKKIPKKDDKDFAKEVWSEITSSIQSANTELKKFIRYYWISKYSFVTEKKLFKEVKKQITDWNELLNDLWDASTWFNKILEGSEENFNNIKNGNKIYKSIFAIRLMGVSQCYVLLLTILKNLNELKTDPTKFIQFIEKFTFQYSVVSKLPGNQVEKLYSKYAIEIETAVKQTSEKKRSGKIQSIFATLKNELLEIKPSKTIFSEKFNEISYKNSTKSRMLIKYILNEIDSELRETKEEKIDFTNVNIEHILPTSPHKDWGLDKKDIKDYGNRIGNLTLLSKTLNGKIQNKIVKHKIGEYKKSSLPITKKLVDELEKSDFIWNKEIIKNRHTTFSNIAFTKIWEI